MVTNKPIFDYKVIRRDRRRTASLQVSPANEVSIIVPHDLSEENIHNIIKRKTPWIISKIRFNEEVKYPFKPKEYVSGESFQYLGRNYRLKVIPGKDDKVELKNGRFVVTIKKMDADATDYAIKELLTQWYMEHAEIKLKQRLERYKDRLGASYHGIKIKSLKRQWGSCTKDGEMNFNWRIVIAPVSIVDYVAAHELCHRIYHDHSKEFWRLLERVMPDYREKKEWLRINGALLDL